MSMIPDPLAETAEMEPSSGKVFRRVQGKLLHWILGIIGVAIVPFFAWLVTSVFELQASQGVAAAKIESCSDEVKARFSLLREQMTQNGQAIQTQLAHIQSQLADIQRQLMSRTRNGQ